MLEAWISRVDDCTALPEQCKARGRVGSVARRFVVPNPVSDSHGRL